MVSSKNWRKESFYHHPVIVVSTPPSNKQKTKTIKVQRQTLEDAFEEKDAPFITRFTRQMG